MSDEKVVSGIIQADKLQQYVDTFSALVDECKFRFDGDGITTSAVDPANVAAYHDVNLSAHAFESYDAPGQIAFGVSLNKLDDYLGSANSDDLVNISIDMETRHLVIRYREIRHEMALIDPDSVRNDPDLPDLELPNHVVVPADALEEAAKNIDLVTDHIWFAAEDDPNDPSVRQFVAYGEGDTDNTSVRWDAEDLTRAKLNGDVESCYGLPYVLDLTKAMPSGEEVTIHFGEEFPTIWEWQTFGGDLTVTSLLAPRITAD